MMNIRMPNLNKVLIAGNLVDDPRVSILESGVHVARMRLASNQSYKGRDGEWHQKTCYVDVVAWRRTAELASEYLRKGSPVLVEGELESSSWQAQDGTQRSKLEIVARRLQFLERQGQGGTAQQKPAAAAAARPENPPEESEPPPEYDDIPF
jgi:single-strand DNA-binding protein